MTRLLVPNRHRAILGRLEEADSATVEELAAALDVSRETIRRDLKHLASEGRLSVVHGGALRGEASEAPLADRRASNRAGKDVIARLATDLVEDGMTVLLDSGTTTEALAQVLARSGRRGLVVHTTSLANARTISRLPDARVFLLGGEFNRNDDGTAGPVVVRALAKLGADIAFVGVGGVDEAGRFHDFTRAAAALRGALIGAATHAYLLADRSKFDRHPPSPVPDDDRAAGVVVDALPPAPVRAALKGRDIRVISP